MTVFFMLMAFLLLTACSVTVEPIKAQPRVVYRSKPESKAAPKQMPTVVSAQWIDQYHKSETQHGSYTIPEDSKIKAIGDKFQVPPEVIKHFQDLTKSVATPTPTPPPNPSNPDPDAQR